jgi:phosphoglycerol transferase MdoB-like AlkP superfamily enzyme
MIKKFISRYHYIIYIGLSFLILDFYLRLNNPGTGIARIISASPNLFTLSYILLFIGIILLLKPKLRKIIYIILISLFVLLFLVNIIYFGIFNSFFSFKNLGLANEGLDYIIPVLKAIDVKIVGIVLLSVILSVLTAKFMSKERNKLDIVLGITFIVLAFFSYASAKHFLGAGVNKLQWDSWNYKRNVYEDYTESKKSLQVSGFYEYVFRDFYFTYIKKESKNTKKDIAYLDNYFNNINNDVNTLSTNEYQGLFKDKNVIVVLMESIDSWLVTEDTMPTLYRMMNEGINFTNHYSVMYDSGATFNSEFMVNTGYMTPFNGGLAAYTYGDNKYPYSLANLFKTSGYMVNQFHFNDGNFYNRRQMAFTYGYENYYSGKELGYANSFEDSLFMSEEELSNLMLPNQKFMSFFTTYSAHMPYTLDSQECSLLISSDNVRKEASKDEEMSCIKAQAGETDKFFKLLLANLSKKKMLDNTVIIGVTDHYTYSFTNQDLVHELKGITDDNLIHKVPFFIWSNNINHQEVTNVNSNIDVLPTIASIFALNYNPKYYLGKNILDSNYNDFVFFRDYSWNDGNTYFKNNQVIGSDVSNEYIKEKNNKINSILDINKKVLETNYFGRMK